MNHELEKITWKTSGKGDIYPEHVASTEQDFPLRLLLWHWNSAVSKNLGHSLFSHTWDVSGFQLFWQMLPLTLRAPSSFTHPPPWAFQQLPSDPGRTIPGTSQPADQPLLGSESRKSPGSTQNKNSLLQLTYKLISWSCFRKVVMTTSAEHTVHTFILLLPSASPIYSKSSCLSVNNCSQHQSCTPCHTKSSSWRLQNTLVWLVHRFLQT